MTLAADQLFEPRHTCRVCESRELERALSLAATPLGDRYVPRERLADVSSLIPLDLDLCSRCGQVQIAVVPNPEPIYSHYLSRPAAVNPALQNSFRHYASNLLERLQPAEGKFAVELGSNDGIFASLLQAGGVRVLGIDPAANLAPQAAELGVETLTTYFTASLAADIRASRGRAELIVANHVFANIDDLGDVMEGVRMLLAPEGIFVVQTGYLKSLVQRNLLETINHDHLSYFSLRTMVQLCARHGLEVFDALETGEKGGSLRVFMQHPGAARAVGDAVSALSAAEAQLGLDRVSSYLPLAEFIRQNRSRLHRLLDPVRCHGDGVAAYGTSIGATTLTYQYDLGHAIDFFVEDDPYRQDLFSPGFGIPVVAPEALQTRSPHYVMVTAPQYAAEIMDKNQAFLSAGGTFVLTWPEFSIERGAEARLARVEK
ncbi:MAG TPA: class I SAM-dependent methyltransferase [Chloroflexota bacterium]|nr:class I SAM-dependent methyltransferase [Chloroflexota bacterium]